MTHEEALDIVMFNTPGNESKRTKAYTQLLTLVKSVGVQFNTDELLALRAEIKDKYGTLDYFAFLLSVSPDYLTKILNGKRIPTKQVMYRIRTLLDKENRKRVFIEQDVNLIKKLNEITTEILKGTL